MREIAYEMFQWLIIIIFLAIVFGNTVYKIGQWVASKLKRSLGR